MNKTSNPVALVLRWAGRNRKYLVASIVCATLSGLMVAVPYFAVFDMMRAVYEGRCTTRVVAVDARGHGLSPRWTPAELERAGRPSGRWRRPGRGPRR